MNIADLELLSDDELLAIAPHGLDEVVTSVEKLGECPIVPHPRQREFLELDDEEVLFGGAVGGAKTEAGFLWLAEGVKHPNFSGCFIRRTYAQLHGSPTSPIERSYKFFKPMGGIFAGNKWTFPNGAVVRFGHMQHEADKHNYDGHEFHRVFVDQVEQLSETQFTYMFSRLRRIAGYPIPCGIRGSANPVGGSWVRKRYVSQQAIDQLRGFTAHDPSPPGMVFDCPGTIGKFMPSRIADNPSLEVDEYIERLRTRLGAVLAAKLANGDWSAVEGSVIDLGDLRYYQMAGRSLRPLLGMEDQIVQHEDQCQRFITVDTAGTSKDKVAESKGKPPSYSVAAVWDHWKPVGLFLRHVWRDRVGWPALRDDVASVAKEWGSPEVLIENAHHGPVLGSELKRMGLRVRFIPTNLPGMGRNKVANQSAKYDRAVASGLLGMISKHQIFLPEVGTVAGTSSWMPEFESEVVTWTGLPEDTDDQVDICSHAAYHVGSRKSSWGGVIK